MNRLKAELSIFFTVPVAYRLRHKKNNHVTCALGPLVEFVMTS